MPIVMLALFYHTVDKHPFYGPVNAEFFTFLCLLIFLFKMAFKPSEKLPNVPKHKKAVM